MTAAADSPASIANDGLYLKTIGCHGNNCLIKLAICDDPSNSKKEKGGADYRANRHLDEEKSDEANEDHEALTGQKSARDAIANQKGDGDGEYAKIVKKYVRRYHCRSDAENRCL